MTLSIAKPLNIASWGLLLVAVIFSSYAYMVGIYNADNSWLMIAAERFLHGETLYVDIMETNPPLIIYLYSIPSLLADALSLPPYVSLIICTQLLMVTSTIWSMRYVEHKTGWLLTSLCCLWLLVGRDFAQREHLFIILCWPLLSALLHDKRPSLAVLIVAGIGTAIKPYFILLWIGIALTQAIQQKSLSHLFTRHFIVLAIVQVAYVVLIYCLHGDYFSHILPILTDGYHFYNRAILDFIQDVYLEMLFGLTIAALGLAIVKSTKHTALFIGAISALLLSALLQHKGYPYHFYPAFCLALLWLCWQLMQAKGRVSALQVTMRIIIIGWVIIQSLTSIFWYARMLSPTADSQLKELSNTVRYYASGEPVFSLSFDLVYPRIILKGNAEFPYPYAQLWPLPNYVLSDKTTSTPAPVTRETDFRNQVIESFINTPPKVVLVSRRDYYWYKKDLTFPFDLIHYFSQDDRFKKAWKNYEPKSWMNMSAKDAPTNYHILYVRKNQP